MTLCASFGCRSTDAAFAGSVPRTNRDPSALVQTKRRSTSAGFTSNVEPATGVQSVPKQIVPFSGSSASSGVALRSSRKRSFLMSLAQTFVMAPRHTQKSDVHFLTVPSLAAQTGVFRCTWCTTCYYGCSMHRNMRLAGLLIAIAFVLGCATGHDATSGAWQSAAGYLSVEPSRLVWFDPEHNDLSVSTILQRDGELVTRHRGRIERVRLAATGDALTVHDRRQGDDLSPHRQRAAGHVADAAADPGHDADCAGDGEGDRRGDRET